jgi:hypothetical protein
MKNLKVLKIEHNPLTWPPLELLQPEQESDHEVWLKNLREYLLTHDAPITNSSHPALLVPHVLPPSTTASSPIPSPLHRNSILSSTLNCRTLVYTFLATYQNKMKSLIEQTPHVDAYMSVLFAAVEIYQLTNYAVLVGTMELSMEINHVNQAALVVLKHIKDNLETQNSIEEVRLLVKTLISSTKDLVQKLLKSMVKVSAFTHMDTRIVQGMISDWSKIIEFLQKALRIFGAKSIEPSDQRFEHLIGQLLHLEEVVAKMDLNDQNSYERALDLAQEGDPKCLEWLLLFLTSCKAQNVLHQASAQLALEAQHLALNLK